MQVQFDLNDIEECIAVMKAINGNHHVEVLDKAFTKMYIQKFENTGHGIDLHVAEYGKVTYGDK